MRPHDPPPKLDDDERPAEPGMTEDDIRDRLAEVRKALAAQLPPDPPTTETDHDRAD